MSITSPTSSEQVYLDLYEGKTLLIKAGGAEMMPEKRLILAQTINMFIRNGIFVTLVFGGQPQIDEHCDAQNDEPRLKVDGIGITNPELLHQAVLPAYTSLCEAIAKEIPELDVMPPSTIRCQQDWESGFVGYPVHHKGLDDLQNKAIGFVGQNSSEQNFNVNADNVVAYLASEFGSSIDEVILLTKKGGVTNQKDELVPLILSSDINNDGTHKTIAVTDGMVQKLKSVRKMLPKAGKVAMTTVEKLYQEITDWKGGGTLCIDVDQLECSKMRPEEVKIFLPIYDALIAQGIFKKRNHQDTQEVFDEHNILRINDSPLGGFSLIEQDEKWSELSTLWAGYLGNGVGKLLSIQWIKQFCESESEFLYALSMVADPDDAEARQKVLKRFTQYGMQNFGPVSEANTMGLPNSLLYYDTTERDPYLLKYQSTFHLDL
mgnify:CR=1 FL=1